MIGPFGRFTPYLIPLLLFSGVWAFNKAIFHFVDGTLYTLHLIVILSASYLSGWKFSLFLTFITVLKVLYFDLVPHNSFMAKDMGDLTRLALFLAGTIYLILLLNKIKTARDENQKLLEISKRAVRTKQELIGIVSHDMRNPLSAIMINAQVIKSKLLKSTEGKEAIARCDSILTFSQSLKTLINDLLELSKLESGTVKLKMEKMMVKDLFKSIEELMAPISKEKEISLSFEILNDVELVFDKEKILRVFSNLLGNAIRFSPLQGTIRIRQERVGQQVRFEITDEGPGIPEEHLLKIFDCYWQEGSRQEKGAGLGLAIAKNIIEVHGGEIGVRSSLGAGSTFYFYLPLKQ